MLRSIRILPHVIRHYIIQIHFPGQRNGHDRGYGDGDPNIPTSSGQAGGTLLQTFSIANISGDGSVTLTHTFTAEVKTYRFYAIANTENVVTELYEDNNLAIRSLKIKAPGEILGPDLVPVKIDLTGTTTDPQTLAISGTAQVTFQNKGDDKITTSFTVLVIEDKDLDNRYTAGVDSLLATGVTTTANFSDEPLPITILMITREYSPAMHLAGRIYLFEHDGSIKWGPVYLNELMPEAPPASYERATVTADIDKDGEPVIGIRVNGKDVILDRDGYLRQTQPVNKSDK